MAGGLLWALVAWFSLAAVYGSLPCSSHLECGWNSQCDAGFCSCVPRFSLSHNGKDCLDDECVDSQCVECIDRHVCNRCVNFIEKNSGKCLDSCSALYDLVVEGQQTGRVCPEGMGELNKTYLAIIIGACAAALLTACVCLIIYWKLRTASDRKARLEFMQKMMEKQRREREKNSQLKYLGIDNQSFDSNHSLAGGHGGNRVVYMKQLADLQPHKENFLAMLKAAKLRLKRMQHDEKKAYVYRNIVHQLGRVLALLVDKSAPMPQDGNALLQWAEKVLHQFLKTQSSPHPSQRSYSTITSTFKPDHRLVSGIDTPDNVSQVDHSTPRYKYERVTSPPPLCIPVDSVQQDREVSEISIVQLLQDDNRSEAIEV